MTVDADPEGQDGLTLLQAVELALRNDPEIQLVANQVDRAQGTLTRSRGTFDPTLNSDIDGAEIRRPIDSSTSTTTQTLSASVSATQRLRSGQTLTPSLTLEREDTADGVDNTATLSFQLRQPLWRGRDRAAVTAEEESAERDLEAARLDWGHTVSERLLAVVSQYWSVKSAALDLDILRATEDSSRELLETTRRLIEAQLTPAAELVQLEADLVLREANRAVAERNLFQAQRQLGNELGLSAEEIARWPLPADPFPTLTANQVPTEAAPWILTARRRRADLQAIRLRREAESVRLVAASDAVRPQLDLVLTPSYSGLTEGGGADEFFTPLWRNVPGASATLSFQLTLPLRNRTALGNEVVAQSAVRQQELLIERQLLSIDNQVATALNAVQRNAERLERLKQAERLFEQSVVNETKKLRAGSSTLIDVISQRDRLTSAQQSRNTAQQTLAVALAELRFQTGTLIEVQSGAIQSLRREDLTTLPSTGEPTSTRSIQSEEEGESP